MKKKLLLYFLILLFCLNNKLLAQTYQLTGNPVNTTGWTLVPSTIVSGDFVRLVDDLTTKSGAIKLNDPINLKYCDQWRVEFDFRIDGNGANYGRGDGFAFWYLANPPITSQGGSGLGIPQNAVGLMVGFDIFNNSTNGQMSKVHIAYGVVQNTTDSNNIEFYNVPGSSFHSPDLNSTQPFVGSTYKRVIVTGKIDPANTANWIITVKIDGNTITSQSFAPSGGATSMTQGYFGFSASTGGATARHSIKNVKIYTDKIPVTQNTITKSFCPGSNTVDLTSFNSQFTANPNNYNFTYYIQGNPTPIADPTNFQFNSNTTIVVYIKDPSQLLCDNGDGKIQLNITSAPTPLITASSSTICYGGSVTLTSNQNTGNTWSTGETTPSITVTSPGTYTLTNNSTGCSSSPASIQITSEANPDVQITGNLILCQSSSTQLTASSAGTGNTYAWSNGTTGNTTTISTPGTYTVTVTTPAGCQYQKSTTVTQGTVPVVQNSSLSQCSNSSTATFDLTSAQSNLSSTPGVSFDYYVSQADAIAGNTNTIANPTAYVSGNATIYVRVKSGSCSNIAQLQLIITTTATPVISVSSPTICYGGSVVLTSNQSSGNIWSTGETTPSITVTTPGTYTVTNTTTGCTSSPASVNITAEANPDVQITGNLIICQSSTQLTASSAGTGNTYVWSNGATGNITSVSTPGTYTVTVTTPAGCQYQKSTTVTQGIVPVVQNSSLSQCSSSSTATFDLTSAQGNLSSTPGVSFDYYVSQADAMAGNTNTIATPTAYVSGNATIYVKVKSGSCSNIAQLQLIITTTATPVISVSSPTICYGGSVVLTSNQSSGNTWSTGETTPSITVTTPGTYTLTNTTTGCTSSPASVNITAEANPDVQITGNLIICQSSTQLTASSAGTGNTYVWSNGTTGNITSVSTPGTYTVTVTTPAGCQYQKTATVTQGAVPVVQNSSLSQCSSSSTATFDLTSAQGNLSSTPGVSFDYYISQADAMAGNTNTIATPTAYISGNATIYVRVKSGTCSNIAELQLIITTTATPVISVSSSTICYGGSVILTSNQSSGNIWSTGETTPSITVTTPGTYTVTNTITGCTSSPASVNITAEANPDVQITGNLIICQSSTQLTASSAGTGNTYAWSNGTTGSSTSVSTPGTYTVTVTTPAGCQYQKTATVTQGAVPVVQNSSLSQCSSSSTATFDLTSAQGNLSSTPGVSFDYYISQADAMAGNTNIIATPTAYVSGNATIYVRVKSTPCSNIAQLQLIVNVKPAPTITASATAICDGTSITLTSSLPTGNTWSTGATTPSITVNTPGTYTLTNNNGTCTSEPVSITVASGTNPNLQITGATTFCQGSSTVLTATATGAGNTFSWSNGATTATNTITTPGTYTVTVTTSAGCQYQKSITVTMDPAIVINIAPPAEINCTTSQITLDATASVYQPGATFLWTATGGGNIVSGGNTLAPTVNSGGTYTLRITSATPNGCVQQSSVTVIRNTTPPSIILSSPKLTICKGESVTITATGATSYVWSTLPGTGNTQTVNPINTTSYTVTGTGSNGCTATATITINVVPEIISPLHDIEICQGDSAILDAGPGPNYTYRWNTGATTQTLSINTSGTYTVIISNGYCSKTFTATISYIPTPQIVDVIYKDPVLTIKAKNNGTTPLEYSIDGGITWQLSNIFQVLRNTKYFISVRNKGVTCSSSTEYYTFFMANVITPNEDGINDVIDFSIISKYGNFDGAIFDRYGKSVFKISSKNPIWDGKYLGRPLPTGTYWYKLSWENRLTKKTEELSGWVLLKNRD